jgi:hypothetical protein
VTSVTFVVIAFIYIAFNPEVNLLVTVFGEEKRFFAFIRKFVFKVDQQAILIVKLLLNSSP